MSSPDLAPTATAQSGIKFELSTGGSVVCIDFRSVAGLIDAVAGYDPVRLSILFPMIWETSFKLETRAVLEVAVACRDPLSDLGTICKDALQSFAALEKLAQVQHWHKISHVVRDPRAGALLNACDHQIARLTDSKQVPYKAIRARLEDAATAERQARREEIQAYSSLRLARCPSIWEIYEQWRDTE